MSAFDRNLENEISASLKLAEADGRAVLIVAVYSDKALPGEGGGGLCRAVSDKVTRKDARVFIDGLRREIRRIEKLID